MDLVKSDVISCSRRTDIPAFLMNWIQEQINQRYVKVVNPFNRSIISMVSLDPTDVIAWVWWSKNFGPWIEVFKEDPRLFTQYPIHIFNFTINSVSELESGLKIPLKDRFDQLNWLVSTFGRHNVQVRFDPIVLYEKYEKNGIYSNLTDFEQIISSVSKIGIREIIFSFVQVYSKVKKRMHRRGKKILELSTEQKKEELGSLLEICNKYGIVMKACCHPDLVGYKGIRQAHCINGDLIYELSKGKIQLQKDKGQRKSCECQKSRDIGGYTGIFTCKHNCDYCYANPSWK
ncbi:MAG: DUF1848 family protein [Candidatus Lokiarchaeota archaeon]|nr:DUF1848 family protein [Candidatus Lokiarchaeota archaeon]